MGWRYSALVANMKRHQSCPVNLNTRQLPPPPPPPPGHPCCHWLLILVSSLPMGPRTADVCFNQMQQKDSGDLLHGTMTNLREKCGQISDTVYVLCHVQAKMGLP